MIVLCILGGIIVGDLLWRLWCWHQARAAHRRVMGPPMLYYIPGGRR
jgi:hypothetical protein